MAPGRSGPAKVTLEEMKRLNGFLSTALLRWLNETGRWPTWWVCEDTQEHPVREDDADRVVGPKET